MQSKPTILYIQHASTLGGSVVSLKEVVLDAISSGYRCVVCCVNSSIAEVYRNIGAEAFIVTIAPLNHNTAYHYKATFFDTLRFLKLLAKSVISFIELSIVIIKIRPAVIHLNSSTLILYTVLGSILRVPTVFHVREYIVFGKYGWRRALIRKIANRFAKAIIYISEHEEALLRTDQQKSTVVYNYVHKDRFLAGSHLYEPTGKFVFMSLGGLFSLKGGATLLSAVAQLPEGFECHFLGTDDPAISCRELRSIEGDAYVEDLLQQLSIHSVRSKVKFLGRVSNPEQFMVKADAVVFWAQNPHFPRPVFEAWLLKKPVIYYNPLFSNPWINDSSVKMVCDSSSEQLSSAIASVQSNLSGFKKIADANFNVAMDVFSEKNFQKINYIYQKLMNSSVKAV
jgi:glycosyltransferase involved in cell wall biosynthesis